MSSLLSWAKSMIGIPNATTETEGSKGSGPRIGLPAVKRQRIHSDDLEPKPPTDYVKEAQRLFLSLGMSLTNLGASRRRNHSDDDEDDENEADRNNIYRNLNVLYTHPKTNGIIFVGNDRAVSNLNILRRNKITSVVNCTRPAAAGTLPNYHSNTGLIRYYDFPVACWNSYVLNNDSGIKCKRLHERLDQLTKFLRPMFQFVERAIGRGENVIIHCLAGAHRAGTTSILCLMHLCDMSAAKATTLAKSIRPVINPISDFPILLELFEKYREAAKAGKLSMPIESEQSKAASGSGSGMNGAAAAKALREQVNQLEKATSNRNLLLESLQQNDLRPASTQSKGKRRRSEHSISSMGHTSAQHEAARLETAHNERIRANMRRRSSAEVLMAASGANASNRNILEAINKKDLQRTNSEGAVLNSDTAKTLNSTASRGSIRPARYSYDGITVPKRNCASVPASINNNISSTSNSTDNMLKKTTDLTTKYSLKSDLISSSKDRDKNRRVSFG